MTSSIQHLTLLNLWKIHSDNLCKDQCTIDNYERIQGSKHIDYGIILVILKHNSTLWEQKIQWFISKYLWEILITLSFLGLVLTLNKWNYCDKGGLFYQNHKQSCLFRRFYAMEIKKVCYTLQNVFFCVSLCAFCIHPFMLGRRCKMLNIISCWLLNILEYV